MDLRHMQTLVRGLPAACSRRRLLRVLAILPGAAWACAASIAAADSRHPARPGSRRAAASPTPLPPAIADVMQHPRYADATWSLLVTDLASGETLLDHDANHLMFTASVRKLFSVGLALDELGAGHRFTTPVYRQGEIDAQGNLEGNLILVAAGDLTLGGRETADGSLAYTNFDHNDANGLGTAILTPQDPLRGLDDLARQVYAAGIRTVSGDVIIDDRLFTPFRVPNQNLLITPIMVNENLVDATVTPTTVGEAAAVEWRPQTSAFTVNDEVTTTAAGTPASVTRSEGGRIACLETAGCSGAISGEIPAGFRAPLSGEPDLVQTFQVEQPAAFARTAFIDALQRAGVTVAAAPVAANDAGNLPGADAYAPETRVAAFTSPPYAEYARLILKVSLNLGANLSLMLFALTQGKHTIAEALAAERQALIARIGLSPKQFDFPTNGSGSPDSQASARAVVQMLTAMAHTEVADAYRAALPILGVDGSLGAVGGSLPGQGHVLAKTGTTIEAGRLLAQNLAGYIDAASGRRLAFALLLNHAGPIQGIEDVIAVLEDESLITSIIYETY